MAELIVRIKSKREEKIVEAFLSSLSIGYHTEEEENNALYKAMVKDQKSHLITSAEKGFC